MRKYLLIMSVGLVLLFAACSDKDTGGKDNVSLTIGLPGGYDVTAKENIDRFIEEHPEIDVKVEESPWGEFAKQITTRIAGDTAPDVWFSENAHIIGFGERGVAEDLTPYIEADIDPDEYADALFSAETPEGKIYGVPHGINPIALGYNKTVFEEAGVDFPTDDWTYEDMIEAAKELTQDTDGDGKTDVYGFTLDSGITQGWFPWIKANGGMALDETLTKSQFTDPKTIEAITIWSDMVNVLEVSPTSDYSKAADGNLFEQGITAMKFIQYNKQVRMNRDFPDLEWDTVKIPKGFNGGERVVPIIANSWLINKKSDDETKEAAWEFLKYYLDDDAQMTLAESGGSLPVKLSTLEKVEAMTDTRPENKAAFTKGIEESGMTMDE